jgi:hypothetical protein
MCHILLTWCCFWTEWTFFYSVVAVPRSADPLTLKAAEFSAYALQPSQYCYDSKVSACIPPVFFQAFFFCSKHWRFSYVSFMCTASASETEWNLFPLWCNVAFKLTLHDHEKPPLPTGVFKLQFFHQFLDVISVHYNSGHCGTRCYVWLAFL